MKPPDLFLVLNAANLLSLSQLVHSSTLDYPLLGNHLSQIALLYFHHDEFDISFPEPVLHSRVSRSIHFQIACRSQRCRYRARELHAFSLFPGFSGFRIQYSLITASTPRSLPLSLYNSNHIGFRLPSCRGLGSFRATQSFSFHMDVIIKGSSLFICTEPSLIHSQLAICRVNHGDLLSELSQWRLLQRLKLSWMITNQVLLDPFVSWIMICLCHPSMVICSTGRSIVIMSFYV